jgi:CrcB protein
LFVPRFFGQSIVVPRFRYYGAAFLAFGALSMPYLWVAVGGALGSVARYGCSTAAWRWLGAGFPYGTLFVNVAGSFAIGLLAALVAADGRPLLGNDARAFLLVGVLGGFTTFSSFSLETLELARGGALGAAAANVALSLVLCLVGAWLGFAAAGLLNR